MLITFDHITFVVNRKETTKTIKKLQRSGYALSMVDDHAVNIPTKLDYMRFKDSSHGLYLMRATGSQGIAIEVIAYEHTTNGKSWISYIPRDDCFTVHTRNVDSCKQLFLSLGCKENNGVFSIKGVLDPKPYIINFLQDTGMSNNLDNEGFCCPTLYVTPGNQTITQLEEAGFECTQPQVFETNGKILYVFFVKGVNGELIEIVTNKL